MFKTILVPTDGSALSEKAINAAIELAHATGGKVVGLSVAEPYPFSPLAEGALAADSGLYEQRLREAAQEHVERVRQTAHMMHVQCETAVATSYSPCDEILKTADEYHCDLIVMASHGRRGLSKLLLGSETQKVLSHASIPVMVLH